VSEHFASDSACPDFGLKFSGDVLVEQKRWAAMTTVKDDLTTGEIICDPAQPVAFRAKQFRLRSQQSVTV
jgi:hypothetical protein